MKRVFDEDFVKTKKYSELLVGEIPKGKFFDMAIEIYNEKELGNIHNINMVWDSISPELNEVEKKELIEVASEELRFTDSPKTVVRAISLFSQNWEEIAEDARLRAENKLIKLIPNSRKDIHGKTNQSGIYVSWLTTVFDKSSLKYKIASKLFDSLNSQDEEQQRYVIDYFGDHFEELEELLFLDSFEEFLKNELEEGNELIYNFTSTKPNYQDKEEFKKLHKEFVSATSEDELPF